MQSSDALSVVRRLHEHRAWVNARLREAARGLEADALHRRFDIGQGTLLDTLSHLYLAERVWLEALSGQAPPTRDELTFETLDDLEREWEELEGRWSRFLASLDASDLGRMVEKRSSHEETVQRTPLLDALLHVCTHGQYTTAQAANMLRQLGHTPPDTQLITMSRGEHSP